jgi:membrane fusion protein, multidrug efflux system
MQDKLTQVDERVDAIGRHDAAPTKRSSAGWVWLILLAVVAGGGYYVWRSTQGQAAAGAGAGAARGGGRRGAAGAGGTVPVVVATVARQNLPLYLDGLGSVQAFYTVTLKSRVDGQMMEVDFKEGQEVKKGDLLAVIDPRPYQVALSQAEANLAKDQSQLADAKLNADRYDQLVKQGVIPQQQYDTQKALAGQLQGSVQADQAQIDSAKLNLTYSRITSPIDGRIGLRLVDPGNIVHASDANGLLVITQMEPIAVVFTIPEDNLPSVIAHMRQGELPVKAMTRDLSSQLAGGMLQTIDNQIDQTTGTVRLKAVFDNKDRSLWPNQFVNARLLLDTQKDAIVIPAAAIQNGSQGTFVYVVKQDKTVEVRPITVGVTEANIASIAKGLNAGEQVVTDGQDRLQAGVTVDAHTDARGAGAAAVAAATGGGNGRGQGGAARAGGQPGSAQGDPAAAAAPSGGATPDASGGGDRRGGRNGERRGDRQSATPDAGGQAGVPKS